MDFAKFVSLVETRSLHFARITSLPDPFEGTYSQRDVALLADLMETPFDQGVIRAAKRSFAQLSPTLQHEVVRRNTYVSCWTALPRESLALWRLYVHGEFGVAVQSTLQRLRDSLQAPALLYGLVRYVDYRSGQVYFGPARPFFHKRPPFAFESEFRVVHLDSTFEGDGAESNGREANGAGLHVPVDLSTLIQGLRVSYGAPDWFFQLIHGLIPRYGVNVTVDRSELEGQPAELPDFASPEETADSAEPEEDPSAYEPLDDEWRREDWFDDAGDRRDDDQYRDAYE